MKGALKYTRWFKYYRDCLYLITYKLVPVIFEPPCTCPGWQETVKRIVKKQPHPIPTHYPSETLLRKFSIWAEIQTKHLLTEVTSYHFRQPMWYQ